MDINKKLIGKRIKHRREVSGLSQEQLAEKLNLSTNHISSMECGKSLLTTKCLLALCDILGGTPDYYLLGGANTGNRWHRGSGETAFSKRAEDAIPSFERLSGK